MRNLLSAWGIAVYNLSKAAGKTCWQLSTRNVDTYTRRVTGGDNPMFSTDITDSFTILYTQAKSSFSDLLRRYFSPLSTAPITTNEKKGLKN